MRTQGVYPDRQALAGTSWVTAVCEVFERNAVDVERSFWRILRRAFFARASQDVMLN